MPDAPGADRRPVPYLREGAGAGGRGAGAPTVEVRLTGNWAAEHPPEPAGSPDAERLPSGGAHHRAPRRSAGRWWSWAVVVLMVAGAGLLVWAPWLGSTDTASRERAAPAAAAGPSSVAGGPAGAPGSGPGQVVDGPIVPTRIAIPAIGVDTTVEHRGTVRQKNAFTGQQVEGYGVPTSMRTTSWWSDGPQPGSGQMAVILGHTQVGGYGVFNKLATLRSGTAVTLRAANGDTLRLTVLGSPVTGLDKSTSALADTLNGHPPGADVALVTCGGQFDDQAKASEDNIVVFATVVHG